MKIRPEFLNRIDEIVLFTPLDKKEIQEIVNLQVKSVQKMLASNGVKLDVTPAALELLAEDGYDPNLVHVLSREPSSDSCSTSCQKTFWHKKSIATILSRLMSRMISLYSQTTDSPYNNIKNSADVSKASAPFFCPNPTWVFKCFSHILIFL